MEESSSGSARPAPARGPELRALLAWIGASWWRPAGSAAAWEQRAGHERATSRPVAAPDPDGPPAGGDKNQRGGNQSSPPR